MGRRCRDEELRVNGNERRQSLWRWSTHGVGKDSRGGKDKLA